MGQRSNLDITFDLKITLRKSESAVWRDELPSRDGCAHFSQMERGRFITMFPAKLWLCSWRRPCLLSRLTESLFLSDTMNTVWGFFRKLFQLRFGDDD